MKNSWHITKSMESPPNRYSVRGMLPCWATTATKLPEPLKAPKAYIEPSSDTTAADPIVQYMTKPQMEKTIERTRKLMQEAAKKLEFIEAAQYRDELLKLEDMMKERWG